MTQTKNVTLVVALVALVIVGWFFFKPLKTVQKPHASSFTECVQLGYPVMESYPRQCRDSAGNLFVEEVPVTPAPNVQYSNASVDDIVVTNLSSGAEITSPLTISGEARGTWYFEASFPVVLTDWDGRIIAEGHASADGDWMTSEFVPFTATISFERPPYGSRGTLILKRDNPSGLPEHDAALEIPIVFK